MSEHIQIGINARLFPANWRPVIQEIEFSHRHGFQSIQFPARAEGLNESHLGSPIAEVAQALERADLMPVMEIVVRVNGDGKTNDGQSPLELLKVNLPAITGLNIRCVHWHIVTNHLREWADLERMQNAFIPDFQQGVEIAAKHGFRFGVEHNEREELIFANPPHCAALLDVVPSLGFVWDFNHTHPDDLAGFQALIPRMTMLHVSDTPLPETNYHLPLGLGNVDFVDYCRTLLKGGFDGAAILEIGGLPKSGGYGRDTDEALIQSLNLLKDAIAYAQPML